MSSSGYRRLLRSIAFAFKGDTLAISQAKKQLRVEFLKNKHITDSQLTSLRKDIDDVDEMLRFHIVQGRKNEKGSFGTTCDLNYPIS